MFSRHHNHLDQCYRDVFVSTGVNSTILGLKYVLRMVVNFSLCKKWGVHILQAIDTKYTKDAATGGPDQEVVFEEEQITLNIPKEGIVLGSGWTITPHAHPGVSLCVPWTDRLSHLSVFAVIFPTDHQTPG